MTELRIEKTAIEGLLVVRTPINVDNRGWFKENWQREKMVALGLPDFRPVQQNISYNQRRGAIRGIHAEPWDKFVSLASGSVFGAWVDLRPGPGFGTVVTLEMGVDVAVFVPYSVANSYQALEDVTTYSYLVDAHWSPEARSRYTYVNLFDPALGIAWPIGREESLVSDADLSHPLLADVTPMARPERGVVILGANGQLGSALRALLPGALALGRAELDVTDPAAVARFDFSQADTVINATGFTAVDDAETDGGRRRAWAVNATAVAHLAAAARQHDFTLVHVSSDYVFDGSRLEHDEDEPLSPLGVYGQSKAAGELAAMGAPRHLVVRTSWLVGNGKNFVATMATLADRGVSPSVIADTDGRLTFADDLAAAILHLVERGATGIYNFSNGGPAMSWLEIARLVFELRGRDAADVRAVTTEEYNAGRSHVAPRPPHSVFSLDRIRATGFEPPEAADSLRAYLAP